MTQNQLTYWANQEEIRKNQQAEKELHRSNLAKEIETNRHNVEMEKLTGISAAASSTQAQAALKQADNSSKAVSETVRSNLAKESQASANLGEQIRSNLATEANTYRRDTLNYNLGMSNLAETIRANQAREEDADMSRTYQYHQTNVNKTLQEAEIEAKKIANSNQAEATKVRQFEAMTNRLQYNLEKEKLPADQINSILGAFGSFLRGIAPFIGG